MHCLPQFHQIGHKERLFFKDSIIAWDDTKFTWMELHLYELWGAQGLITMLEAEWM